MVEEWIDFIMGIGMMASIEMENLTVKASICGPMEVFIKGVFIKDLNMDRDNGKNLIRVVLTSESIAGTKSTELDDFNGKVGMCIKGVTKKTNAMEKGLCSG
jgi:hypothetical protein